MKIHILCNDGSPLGVTPDTIYGDQHRVGVGGAELALLTLAEYWSINHEVVLYNDPWYQTDRLDQRPIEHFNPFENRDVLIVFRSPTDRVRMAVGYKVWWSCDQNTVGNFNQFSKLVNQVVTISPRHADYFKYTHNIPRTTTIDLPVRDWDYDENVDRVDKRLLFSSVPDRGLDVLAKAYPYMRNMDNDLSLTITSDYRLWGATENNHQHKLRFARQPDVRFLGALPRIDFVREQLASDCLAYPCTYDELFCIAASEAQVAGAFPVTTPAGSLVTTNMGWLIGVDPRNDASVRAYAEKVVEFVNHEDKEKIRLENQNRAKERFSIERITQEWQERVFGNV